MTPDECLIPDCERPPRNKRGWCDMHYKRWLKYGDPTKTLTAATGEPARYLADLVANPPDGCVLWPFAKTPGSRVNQGGSLFWNGKSRTAHSVALELSEGPPPPNFKSAFATHDPEVCNQSLCVNPPHLKWVDGSELQSDRLVRGTDHRGEKNSWHKLTETDVLEIVDALNSGASRQALANDYNVSYSCIRCVDEGRSWSWLTGRADQ